MPRPSSADGSVSIEWPEVRSSMIRPVPDVGRSAMKGMAQRAAASGRALLVSPGVRRPGAEAFEELAAELSEALLRATPPEVEKEIACALERCAALLAV